MDVSTVSSLVSSLGFPIVCVLGLSWFAWYMVKTSSETNAKNMEQVQARCKEREDKLYEEIKENRAVNAKAIETIAHYAAKLDDIQHDIKDIKSDITVIKAKEL